MIRADIGVTRLITLGGGGEPPWVSETLIYERVELERGGKIGLNLNIHTHLYPTLTAIFFICPLFNSVPKRKLFLNKKYIGRQLPAPPPPPNYAYA
jgi:hypothetical protein